MIGPRDVLREQTIPALRGSGGDGHADAIEAVLARVADLERQLQSLDDQLRLAADLIVREKDRADAAERQLADARVSVATALKGNGWVASVGQGRGRCDAVTLYLERCRREGPCGWGDKRYCVQHHPDWDGWYFESARLRKIAQAAIDAAMASEPSR